MSACPFFHFLNSADVSVGAMMSLTRSELEEQACALMIGAESSIIMALPQPLALPQLYAMNPLHRHRQPSLQRMLSTGLQSSAMTRSRAARVRYEVGEQQ